jgi:hypothetical protein
MTAPFVPPARFFELYIARWEGRPGRYLSLDPNDNGNWYQPGAGAQRKGQGALIGSNYGVTGATLATYRGNPIVTAADIARLTLADAAAIATRLFYVAPGLAFLPWNRVTASIVDFGWGAGPVASIRMLQDLLDCGQDGRIGSAAGETASAYKSLLAKGEEFAAGAWWAMREEYYEDLVVRRPSDALYLNGWDNRSDWFTPGHPEGMWGMVA